MNAAGLGDRIYAMFGALRPEPLLVDGSPMVYGGKPRHPRWDSVRAAHLRRFPFCAVCGVADSLNVHHRRPYHLFPADELDPENLMTLCASMQSPFDDGRGGGCHLTVGHCGDWSAWNDEVVAHAEILAAMLSKWRLRRAR